MLLIIQLKFFGCNIPWSLQDRHVSFHSRQRPTRQLSHGRV